MTATLCPHCGHRIGQARTPLTGRQRDVLVAIGRSIRDRGVAPSYKQIAHAVGLKSLASVAEHIDGLVRKGWVAKTAGAVRGLELACSLEELGLK